MARKETPFEIALEIGILSGKLAVATVYYTITFAFWAAKAMGKSKAAKRIWKSPTALMVISGAIIGAMMLA